MSNEEDNRYSFEFTDEELDLIKEGLCEIHVQRSDPLYQKANDLFKKICQGEWR